jgi:hypothetical protein
MLQMNNELFHEKLIKALDRTVPIGDPQYMIGEDETIDVYMKWVDSISNGIIGSVVLGQIGNGKTHFIRYIRRKMQEETNSIGIYMPDMFINGPLSDALNGLYSSIFRGSGNKNLRDFIDKWGTIDIKKHIAMCETNNIIRYLLRCNNKDEELLVLDYFSNKEMFPDDLSFLRKRFNAKKRFINNENEFVKAFIDALQFMQLVTGKNILILIDEVDKVYSDSTSTISLTKVGYKILTAYRTLFDYLNANEIRGIITVVATFDAWEVLSWQTAFERRFKDHRIVLKTPKSKSDVFKFVVARFNEIGYEITDEENQLIGEQISNLRDEELKSWADIISGLRNSKKKEKNENGIIDPEQVIIEVLGEAIKPLTWEEMINQSKQLNILYPKGQPTKLLQRMYKEKIISISDTQPYTYELM